ncbi:hypothetical protein LINPERHAP1_LOCUS21855, partial [Linum perenne]
DRSKTRKVYDSDACRPGTGNTSTIVDAVKALSYILYKLCNQQLINQIKSSGISFIFMMS